MRIAFFCLFLFTYIANFAQVLNSYHGKTLTEILENKISHSDMVLEGEVIEKKAFKDKVGAIYTSYLVRASRIFKGAISDSLVEFIYYGGTIGDDIQWRSDGISFGDDGIYFLDSNTTDARLRTNIKSYVFYGNPIIYHNDPVNRRGMLYIFYFDDFDNDLYP